MYRIIYYTIYFFILLFISSCGSVPRRNNNIPELDTSLYKKYIRTGIDTNLYPVFQYSSSQKFPISIFGFEKIFDGDKKTYWSSDIGLNAGEWIVFEFLKLNASFIKIDLANEIGIAKTQTFKLYANDSLLGFFGSGMKINLPPNITKLKIEANDAEGLNEVTLPTSKDSIGNTFVTLEKIVTRYNSKSFGISEIEFYNQNSKKLPMKALPTKNVIIQSAYFKEANERTNVADGNPNTSTSWFKANNEGKLIFIFDDYTAFTKIRFHTSQTPLYNYPPVAELLFNIGGKPDQEYKLKSGLNEFTMKEPFVAKTFTISFKNFVPGQAEGSINEVQGFDGLQWYTLIGDSVIERGHAFKDSLKNTPLHAILNSEFTYLSEKAILKSDTFTVKDVKQINSDWIKERTDNKQKILIRSNGTWQSSAEFNTLTYGKNPSYFNKLITIEGNYKLTKKSSEEVVLFVRYKLITVHKKDGKELSKKTEFKTGQIIVSAQKIWVDGLIDMRISY